MRITKIDQSDWLEFKEITIEKFQYINFKFILKLR